VVVVLVVVVDWEMGGSDDNEDIEVMST